MEESLLLARRGNVGPCRIVCSSCVLHESLIAKTGVFPEELEFKAVEDYVRWLRVAALADFGYCSEALVRYRDDSESGV
jgi:hypothetical protein